MATQIHVVLHEIVRNLGESGDVVRVRPGYARNYLIPRGLAVPATEGNLARVDELKHLAVARAEKARDDAKELAKKIESRSIKISRTVGEQKKMFGSVTARDIEEAYEAIGIKIDRKKIQLEEPIKQLGLTEVPIKLQSDIEATLRVEVIKASS